MRNRVREVRNIKASELRANPRNWRLHPDEQRSALSSMLEEIGFVGTLIARDTPDGLELIDGHLRADLADDAEIPVAIVDLDDDEAARVLATFDPLGEMALVDDEQLKELLGMVEVDGNAELPHRVRSSPPVGEGGEGGQGPGPVMNCRGMMGAARHRRFDVNLPALPEYISKTCASALHSNFEEWCRRSGRCRQRRS